MMPSDVRLDCSATGAEPEAEVREYGEPEAQSFRDFVPIWGTRATLWQWLVVIAASAIFCVLFARATHARVERFGASGIPRWCWDVYDLRVWPLSWLKGGAYAPTWWPW